MEDETVTDLATRFERNVDRSGDHHRSSGAGDPRRGTSGRWGGEVVVPEVAERRPEAR